MAKPLTRSQKYSAIFGWYSFPCIQKINIFILTNFFSDNKAVYNRNGGLHIADNLQQIPALQPDSSRRTWSGVGDPNNLLPFSSLMIPQMPQFPMKPLQFPQKQPTYTQYQSDLLPKNVEIPVELKNQQQYTWPVIGPNLPNLPNNIHPDHNNNEGMPEKDVIGVIKDVPVSDRKKDGKNLLTHSKSESKSMEDSDYNNEEEEEMTTEPPKKKKKHRKVNKVGKQAPEEQTDEKDSTAQQLKIITSELQTEFMDHADGEAERPGGAVVSLALGFLHLNLLKMTKKNPTFDHLFCLSGILITIGLVMVVSCRTTAVRKRVRHGKGYAHDADFLVNGMYL